MLLQLHPHNLMLLWLHRHNLTSYTEQITLVGVTAQSISYQTESCQLFCVRSNKTAVTGNAIIASRQSKAPPIPEEWGFYAKTFECTHAGKYAPRGEGQRPHQNVRPLGCKAQINLCYPTTRLAIRDDVMTSVDILQRSGVKKKKTILNLFYHSKIAYASEFLPTQRTWAFKSTATIVACMFFSPSRNL
ncbi:hypothetical protein PC121_g20318 [Phytophthora cactorum]|nr:hypothetical protein PC121_g20318 [Phytophthora cactorum]